MNVDPPDVAILQDLTRYRLELFRYWPASLGPLLVSAVGDYWIARECGGFTRKKSVGATAVMAGTTVLFFKLTGGWTLPWPMMWVEVLILGALKWLIFKYAFGGPAGKREYIAYTLFSFTFCLSQWVYASTHMFRT